MKKKLRIAVIFGGRSGEHEVSLVSAQSVINALNTKKYEIIPIGITKNGEWMTGKYLLESFKKGSMKNLAPANVRTAPQKGGISVMNKNTFDIAFPVLHGPYGEDGTIQGLFEMMNIPYVGAGVLASAICMDKFMTKIIFQSYGLPQAKFLHFFRESIKKNPESVQIMVKKNIGFPCFVKPSNLGSSVGISKVKKLSELKKALLLGASYDTSILVEEAVDAREIECSVLGNENPSVSAAGEIIPNREFYDYFAKYVDGASKLIIPAKISAQKMQEVQTLAVKAYRAVQCSGMARVDFLMDRKSEKLYVNELNTIPGFTSISMYPKLWAASGLPYPKLLERLIQLAIEKHKEKQKNKMTFESKSDWYKK